MKVCIIQPRYYFDYSRSDIAIEEELSLLDKCDESMDIIVLPEYSDVLADMKNAVGIKVVEIDPQRKYYKAPGFNGVLKSHYEYVDEGRKTLIR